MKLVPIILVSGALTMGMANIAAGQEQAGPPAAPNASQNPAVKSPNQMTQEPLAKGHNSFTKAEALGRIQKAGYSKVQNLTLDADGLWQATAQQKGQTVHVALDYKGNVSSQ